MELLATLGWHFGRQWNWRKYGNRVVFVRAKFAILNIASRWCEFRLMIMYYVYSYSFTALIVFSRKGWIVWMTFWYFWPRPKEPKCTVITSGFSEMPWFISFNVQNWMHARHEQYNYLLSILWMSQGVRLYFLNERQCNQVCQQVRMRTAFARSTKRNLIATHRNAIKALHIRIERQTTDWEMTLMITFPNQINDCSHTPDDGRNNI